RVTGQPRARALDAGVQRGTRRETPVLRVRRSFGVLGGEPAPGAHRPPLPPRRSAALLQGDPRRSAGPGRTVGERGRGLRSVPVDRPVRRRPTAATDRRRPGGAARGAGASAERAGKGTGGAVRAHRRRPAPLPLLAGRRLPRAVVPAVG